MGRLTRCPDQDTLTQLSEGELRGRRLWACLRHLQNCPRCRAEVAGQEALRGLLAHARAPGAPPQLPARIAAAVASAEEIPHLTCRQARPLICAVLDGEATLSDEERLWAHLFHCAPCLRLYRETGAVVAVPRRAPSALAPSYLPQRIFAAVAQLQPAPRRRPAPVGLALAGAAALVLVAFLGLRTPRPASVSVTEQPRVAAVLPGTVPSGPAASAVSPGTAPAASTVVPASRLEPRRGLSRSVVPPPSPGAAYSPSPLPALPPPRGTATHDLTPAPAPVLPLPAYTPSPTPAPTPAGPPLLPPRPAPAPAAPLAIAAAPRIPTAPLPAPAASDSGGRRPVTTSNPPEDTRPLRWTPSQPASVVVIHRQPGDHDAALARASRALSEYGRQLKRSQPKQFVVAR